MRIIDENSHPLFVSNDLKNDESNDVEISTYITTRLVQSAKIERKFI